MVASPGENECKCVLMQSKLRCALEKDEDLQEAVA